MNKQFDNRKLIRRSTKQMDSPGTISGLQSRNMEMPLQHAQNQAKPKTKFGILFLAAWGILALYDTGLMESVPAKSLLRPVIVAAFGLSVLLWGRRASFLIRSSGITEWIIVATLIGFLSTVFCIAPEIGFIKMALFVFVLPPLLYFTVGPDFLFGEAFDRRWIFAACSVFFAIGLYRGVFPAATSEFANTNYVSSLAVATLPAILIRGANEKTFIFRLLRKWAPAIVVAICVLNHSRGALAGSMAFLIVWLAFTKKPDLSRFITFAIIGSVAIVLTVYASEAAKDYLSKSDENFIDQVRENELQLFSENFQARPLLGYGFGLSWRVSREHIDMVLRYGRLSWAVGEFGSSLLAVLAGGGVLLLGAIVGLFASMFRYAFRASQLEFRNYGASARYKNIVILAAGIVGLLTNSLSEGWFLSPMTLPAFSLWLYSGSMLYYSGQIYATAAQRRA